MLHSVAPRDAARLQVTGYDWRSDADTQMGGQKPFESNSRRKAILPNLFLPAIANDTGECFPDFTDVRLHIQKIRGRNGVGPAFFAWLGYAGTIAVRRQGFDT